MIKFFLTLLNQPLANDFKSKKVKFIGYSASVKAVTVVNYNNSKK